MSRKTIEFFLFDGAVGTDITGPLDVFSIATRLFEANGEEDKGYSIRFSAENIGLITLEAGLKLYADHKVDDTSDNHILLIPGGYGVHSVRDNPDLVSHIRAKALNASKVATTCTGSYILAATGLLDGRDCTTHWSEIKRLSKTYPNIQVRADVLYAKSGNAYTSAGITAGIDLALALLEEDYGVDAAMAVARFMVLYLHRPGDQSQFSPPIELRRVAGQKYSALHDWVSSNLTKPLQVEVLADHMHMSPRNFYRDFVKATGTTPGKFVEQIRINKARDLLETTEENLDSVANLSGFQREERLRRVFQRSFGITPSQYRLHFSKGSSYDMRNSPQH